MNLINLDALKCPSCGAAATPGQQRCQFCGTELSLPDNNQQADASPVISGDERIVDYYSLIGMSVSLEDPPNELEVREHAVRAQQSLLTQPHLDPVQRDKLIEDIEIGGWILGNERTRRAYDGLLFSLSSGNFNAAHIDQLKEMQNHARRELGLGTDDQTAGEDLLQQGMGYLSLEMYKEAAAALKDAVAAMPDAAHVHYYYGKALLGDESTLSKTPHNMRQAAASFQKAAALDPSLADAAAYEALCQGLLERESGNAAEAQAHLRRAANLDTGLGMAWRGLAALALQQGRHDDVLDFCRRALLKDSSDEQAYLLLVASCWRSGKRDYARDAAGRVARIRGQGWNADRVLKDIVG